MAEQGTNHADFAFTAIPWSGKFIIARVDEGSRGCRPLPDLGQFTSYGEARAKAEELNQETGVGTEKALWILLGTIRRVDAEPR